MSGLDTEEIMEQVFNSFLLKGIQEGLKTSMKGSDFVFDFADYTKSVVR